MDFPYSLKWPLVPGTAKELIQHKGCKRPVLNKYGHIAWL